MFVESPRPRQGIGEGFNMSEMFSDRDININATKAPLGEGPWSMTTNEISSQIRSGMISSTSPSGDRTLRDLSSAITGQEFNQIKAWFMPLFVALAQHNMKKPAANYSETRRRRGPLNITLSRALSLEGPAEGSSSLLNIERIKGEIDVISRNFGAPNGQINVSFVRTDTHFGESFVESMKNYIMVKTNLPNKVLGHEELSIFKKGMIKSVAAVYNEEKEFVVIFANRLNLSIIRKMLSLLPAIFPEVYQALEENNSLHIMALLSSQVLYQKWESCFKSWLKDYAAEFQTPDQREVRQRIMAKDSEADILSSQMVKDIVRAMQSQLREIDAQIGRLDDQYQRLNEARNSSLKELFMVENGSVQFLGDFIKALKNNPMIVWVKKLSDGNTIKFGIRAPMEYYDHAMMRRVASKGPSPSGSGGFTNPNIFDFTKYILSERIFEVYLYAVFSINLRNNSFDVDTEETSRSEGLARNLPAGYCAMPNPHLFHYRCTGGFRNQIMTMISSKEYGLATEACVASVSTINFNDGTVMSRFSRKVSNISDDPNYISGKAIKHKETGVWISLPEFYSVIDCARSKLSRLSEEDNEIKALITAEMEIIKERENSREILSKNDILNAIPESEETSVQKSWIDWLYGSVARKVSDAIEAVTADPEPEIISIEPTLPINLEDFL